MHYVLNNLSDFTEILQSIGLGAFESIEDIDFASLHLILNHPKIKASFSPELLLGQFQIPPTIQVFKMLERSTEWPKDVLNWLCEKKIKPHELSFMNLLIAEENKRLLQLAARSPLSKIDSLNFLEIASELLLMKIDITAFFKSAWTDSTLIEIKNLRYPINFAF